MTRHHIVLPCLLAVALPCQAAAQPRELSPLAAWRSVDVAVLVERAGSVDPAARASAACALRERRAAPPAAMTALVALLTDDTAVPVSVCQAGDDRDGTGAPRTTSPGREAAGALAAAGAVAFAPLTAALEHRNPIARRHAALGLGMLDDARAVEPLIAHLTDAEPLVRAQAAWALGAIDDARAVLPPSRDSPTVMRACARRVPGRSAPSTTRERSDRCRKWSPIQRHRCVARRPGPSGPSAMRAASTP